MALPRPLPRLSWRVLVQGGVLVLVTGACTLFSADDTSTTVAPTTLATSTTVDFPERATTSTTLAEGVERDVAESLVAQVDELIETTEALRALQFLQEPGIVVLPASSLAVRLAESVDRQFEPASLLGDVARLRLLGVADETDLTALYRTTFTQPVVALYDETTGELVVSAERTDLTAVDRTVIVHELLRALTDQHFGYFDAAAELSRAGATDAAAALAAMYEGDATYFRLLYIDTLEEEDRIEVVRAGERAASALARALPDWVQREIAFPYDNGLAFVEQLITFGGIAALDSAYLDPPASTEHILHADRYLGGETVREIPELVVAIDGYAQTASGSLGEWGLRTVLGPTLPEGLLTQTADGWAADTYRLLANNGDVIFIYAYAADTVENAIEVAQGLVAQARGPMGAGSGIEIDGGILFDEGGPWVFIDRIGDGLVFIAATDDDAGRAARPQVRVP